jgi:hypothetical protein
MRMRRKDDEVESPEGVDVLGVMDTILLGFYTWLFTLDVI